MPGSPFAQLNHTNYSDWKDQMEAWLTRKDLWEIVNGTEERPMGSDNSKAVKAWKKKRSQGKAEIVLNVETSQLPHTRFDDPAEIWAQLRKVHRARGLSSRLALKRQLYTMKKKPEQTMEAWIAAVQDIIHNLSDDTHEMDVEDHVIALLQGLPPEYGQLENSLDSMPLEELTVDYVVSRMLTFETRQAMLNGSAADGAEAISNSAHAATRNGKDYSRVRCYNCRRRGHIAPDCPVSENDSSDGEKKNGRKSRTKDAHFADQNVNVIDHAF